MTLEIKIILFCLILLTQIESFIRFGGPNSYQDTFTNFVFFGLKTVVLLILVFYFLAEFGFWFFTGNFFKIA